MALSVRADLAFTASVPAARRPGRATTSPPARPAEVAGRVTADGHVVTVEFAPLPSLVVPAARSVSGALADQLVAQGLTVRIVGPDRVVALELGRGVEAPRWQRLLTRHPSIRIGSVRTWIRTLRGPKLLTVPLPRTRLTSALKRRAPTRPPAAG